MSLVTRIRIGADQTRLGRCAHLRKQTGRHLESNLIVHQRLTAYPLPFELFFVDQVAIALHIALGSQTGSILAVQSPIATSMRCIVGVWIRDTEG